MIQFFYTYENIAHFSFYFLLKYQSESYSIRNLFLVYILFGAFFLETGEGAGLRSPAYRIREAAECWSLVCFGAHLLADATPPEIVVKVSSPSTYRTVFCIIQVLAVL